MSEYTMNEEQKINVCLFHCETIRMQTVQLKNIPDLKLT